MRAKLLMSLAAISALAAMPAFAQTTPSTTQSTLPQAGAPGCGANNVTFTVKTDKKQHPFPQAPDGKAIVYFMEDDTQYGASPKPTMRAGVDGQWLGATHGTSYAYFAIDPGDHHFCTSWGTPRGPAYASALHFTAEAGKSYFFRVQNSWRFPDGEPVISNSELQKINGDEGQLLASEYPLATSAPKKH